MRKQITTLITLLLFAHSISSQTVKGIITDNNGDPLSAVIVEQKNSDEYSLSNMNGEFSIAISEKQKPILIFRYVGYFTRTITLPKEYSGDTLYVTMFPGDDAKAQRNSLSHRTHVGGFALHAGYQFHHAKFDKFTELKKCQINNLNKNMHYVALGLSGYIYSFYLNLNFGISPLFTHTHEEMNKRYMNESYTVSFDMGYGVSLMPKREIIFTPYIGVNHLNYTIRTAPKDKNISLDQFFNNNGETNLNMLQYAGSVGFNFSFALSKFGFSKLKLQGVYIVADAAYIFPMHRTPIAYARNTNITTDSRIDIFPLHATLTLQYMITTKNKTWKKI